MAKSPKEIMRRSIFILLKGFHIFTSTPSLLALPFALATLLSPSFASSSYLFPLVHRRINSLILASGFPHSELFVILSYKISQMILSTLLALPFALSSLLLSKLFTIRAFQPHKTFSWTATFKSLLITRLCNLMLILSTNATFLCLLVISFNCLEFSSLSSRGALVLVSSTLATAYTIVLANAYIICNLSLILSILERHGGFGTILKSCVMTRGRIATALSLTVRTNLALFAIDALFQYRVVRSYRHSVTPDYWMVLEALLLAYLYSVLLVFDTIVGCVFLKSFRHDNYNLDAYLYRIIIRIV